MRHHWGRPLTRNRRVSTGVLEWTRIGYVWGWHYSIPA